MNKKIVIMLAAVVAVVSVILVSIIGQIPNYDTNILVKEIIIEGYLDENNNLIPCKVNANGDKIISLDEVEPDTILVLKVSVNPDNANNPDVRYSIDVTDGSVMVSSQGIVTFNSATRTSAVVTVTAVDGSLVSDRVIITKRTGMDSGDFVG
ncbi:MAG TPA: hypothetical protein H9686_01195 [Firmicutes bacterium]|nr:hypothetical protein [Bacillota bacterium]